MTEEIDESKKYDFISLYNVAEHMIDVDVKLKKYFELLNDDGLLYIAVPQWFGQFYNPGPGNCDIEYYYHADHVNVWTREIFESILAKCGFEIVKSNFTMYNPKYICKKMAAKTEWTPFKHDYLEIKTRMLQIRKCFDAFMGKDFKSAIDAYPNCSMAWKGLYESARKQYHEEGIESMEGLMKAALNACPDSTEVVIFTADLYQRYEHFERALECWNMALRMRPNSPVCLGNIAHCLRGIYRKTGEQKYLIEARDISRHIAKISLENLPEMLTWIYNDNSKIVRE
jgi:hypothetical protein